MNAATLSTTFATSRLVLRDGSTAGVRPAVAADRAAMRRFFDELSPNSRRLRFLATAGASEDLIARFCDSADPAQSLTLIVCRLRNEETQIIGVGSYFASAAYEKLLLVDVGMYTRLVFGLNDIGDQLCAPPPPGWIRIASVP